jgi:hypothetical protein
MQANLTGQSSIIIVKPMFKLSFVFIYEGSGDHRPKNNNQKHNAKEL